MGRVLVQVSAVSNLGTDLAPRPPEVFSARADEIADGIAEVAKHLGRRLDSSIGDDPDAILDIESVQLSFGLSIQAETNVLVVKAGGQSTFTATVTWSARR